MFAIVLLQHQLEAQAPQAAQKNINLQVLRTLQIPKPDIDLQKDFSRRVHQIRQQFFNAREIEESLDWLLAAMQTESFSGNFTAIWRASHRRDLEIAARARDAALRQANGKAGITEYVPIAHHELPHPERYWLTNHLGEVQGIVWNAIQKWDGTLIPSEDLDSFRQSAPQIEDIEDANDHILCTLSQLAGLGLIAQVSVPNQQGEYVVGYRGLRDGERVLPFDLQSALEPQR